MGKKNQDFYLYIYDQNIKYFIRLYVYIINVLIDVYYYYYYYFVF